MTTLLTSLDGFSLYLTSILWSHRPTHNIIVNPAFKSSDLMRFGKAVVDI